MLNFFIGLITALLVLYYVFDGYSKGALYMLIYMVRLFGSFFITRFICDRLSAYLMDVSSIRSAIYSFAAHNMQALLKVPGISFLFSGRTLTEAVEPVAQWILYMLCFIVVFVLLMLLFSYLLKISKIVNKVPVLGCFNRIVGGAEGLIYGVLFTLLLINMAAFVFSLFGETGVSQALMSSWLVRFFETGGSWI